jgi:MFS family permease
VPVATPAKPSRSRAGIRGFVDALVPASRTGRVLAYCATVDSLTIGLFLAATTLYFVAVLGIPAVTIATALAVANIAGLVIPVPLGGLADRIGARKVYVSLMGVRATAFLGYVFVTDVVGYLLVTCVISAATRSCLPLLQVVVGEAETEDTRTRTMASMRAFNNIGLTVGFLLSGLAQLAHSRFAFQVTFCVCALALASVGAAMVLVGRLVTAAPAPSRPGGEAEPAGRSPARDWRFLVVTAGNAVMMVHDSVLFILLPLWVVRHGLSGAVTSVLFVINTVLTILLQVVISRYANGAARALRLLRWACLALLVACALFAFADTGDAVVALLLAVTLVVTLTVGENLHSTSGWELSFVMAPRAARARYLSLFSVGTSTQLVFGPVLMTAVVLPLDVLGWVVMGALFLAATAAITVAAKPFATEKQGDP